MIPKIIIAKESVCEVPYGGMAAVGPFSEDDLGSKGPQSVGNISCGFFALRGYVYFIFQYVGYSMCVNCVNKEY